MDGSPLRLLVVLQYSKSTVEPYQACRPPYSGENPFK